MFLSCSGLPFPHTTRIYSACLLILKTCASLCLGIGIVPSDAEKHPTCCDQKCPVSCLQCDTVWRAACTAHGGRSNVPQTSSDMGNVQNGPAGQDTTEISIPCDYITCLIFTEDKSSTTIVFFQMTERQRHDLVTSKLAYFFNEPAMIVQTVHVENISIVCTMSSISCLRVRQRKLV